MKENLVSLAKLLATDDEFNLAFSSRGTDEEKYELAKTKFTNLTREDFSEFLEKLHEVEKANFAELLPDELELISGGAGGWATKLAAAAMFVTALGATGVMSQQADAFTWTDSVSAKIMDKVVNDQDSEAVEKRKKFVEGLATNPSSTKITSYNFVDQLKEAGFSDDIVTKLNYNVIKHQSTVNAKKKGSEKISIREAILAELADLPFYQYIDANDINNLKRWLQRDTKEVGEILYKLKKAAAAAKDEVLTKACFVQLKLPEEFSLDSDNAYDVVDTIDLEDGKQITVTNKVLMHIMFGDYDEYGAFLAGGHTVKSLNLRDSIENKVFMFGDYDEHGAFLAGRHTVKSDSIGNNILKRASNLNVTDEKYLKDYCFRTLGYYPASKATLANGCLTYSVLQKYKEQEQIFFPEAWTWENVKQAIKATYDNGKIFPAMGHTCKVYTSPENNISTKIFFKSSAGEKLQLVTCYAEEQRR